MTVADTRNEARTIDTMESIVLNTQTCPPTDPYVIEEEKSMADTFVNNATFGVQRNEFNEPNLNHYPVVPSSNLDLMSNRTMSATDESIKCFI